MLRIIKLEEKFYIQKKFGMCNWRTWDKDNFWWSLSNKDWHTSFDTLELAEQGVLNMTPKVMKYFKTPWWRCS